MSIRKLSLGLGTTLLAALISLPSGSFAASSIDVGMIAAFPSPPYLTELLETAAQENASSYFPILDRIASGYFSKAATDRDLYETFLGLVQDDNLVSSSDALSTFKLALSLRSAAPRIEAHFQFYRTAVEAEVADSQDGCDQWILWEGAQYCSPSFDKASAVLPDPEAQLKALPFDTKLGHGTDAILYADITAPEFGPFHAFLAEKARKGELSYRLRHVRRATEAGKDGSSFERLPVSGYGVELVLKRTDYIVIDDRENAAASADDSSPDKTKPAAAATEVVLDGEEDVADLKALSKSELTELGLKAADYIVQSADPMETLLKLTQDFPKYSSSIAAHNVSADFVAEHHGNRMQLVPPGVNVLWMNGVQLIERQMQAFTLVDAVRRERELIGGVQALGLTAKEAVDVLGHEAVAASKAGDAPLRFDWRDEIEDGRAIVWLNDIETDARYANFPTSISKLLQSGQRGQIPPVRRNMFHQVYAVDLTDAVDVKLVAEQILGFVNRMLPIRFGFVPLTYSPASASQAKVAYYLLETYGLDSLTAYLEQSLKAKTTASPDAKVFDAAVKGHEVLEGGSPLALADVLASEHYEQGVRLAKHWADRLGADSPVPPIFVDGEVVPRDEGWLQTMSAKLGLHLRSVQEGVYYGTIGEDTWVPGHFLEGAVTKRNAYIFPDESVRKLTVVDVNKLHMEHADLFDSIPVIEASTETTKETWAVLTLVADLDSDEGMKLLFSALQFRLNNPGVRLDVVYNPAATPAAPAAFNSVLRSQDAGELMEVESWEALKALLTAAAAAKTAETAETAEAAETTEIADYVAAVARFRETAAIGAGTNMVILNGRVVGPIESAQDFGEDTFLGLLEFEQRNRILPVYEAVEGLELTAKVSSPLAAAKLTSITALSTISELPDGIFESAPTLRISAFKVWNASHTAFEVGDEATATVHFTAVVNPASEVGQRWAPILRVLAQLDGVFMRVFLNPRDRLDELPVKRFYRSVLEAAPAFDEAGRVRAASAHFSGLPSEALLNLGMDVPPAWLVAPKESVQDLDNIKLSKLSGGKNVEATYELEHILIEGHSREVAQQQQQQRQQQQAQPPRGAQLVLATEAGEGVGDTIIMSNLGYFQFKANPGCYQIQLKQGRSSDIFAIESVGPKGMAVVPGDEGTDVTLMDFQGTTLYPRLARRPGMELEDVLLEGTGEEVEGGGGSVADYVSKGLKFAEGILGGKNAKVEKDDKDGKAVATTTPTQADINIFSVASGHLYERMLNIMMVSVMKHTNHTVKFWFIEQFLSPSFKDFIPTLAQAYGFEYEMVTYKWPHWLRQQREKQREIWGYKILFLDVLFPLSLDKVIFVDADQIVRTDMYDLVSLDLEGAPYGFTPMCDSRTEMEGFRFWKQGYWRNYLRNGAASYHISALYVVDLQRFRALAAGDRLRQTYHTLSADPNSLANLDQDLPNHMQFQIPIFSLPQDWLWCETWCSDEALATARTIDLCNNPQTKEPKLDRARRQVPEWTVYDDEIAALAREAREKEKDQDKDQEVVHRRRGQGVPMREAAGEAAAAETFLKEEAADETTETPQREASDETTQDTETSEPAHTRDEL